MLFLKRGADYVEITGVYLGDDGRIVTRTATRVDGSYFDGPGASDLMRQYQDAPPPLTPLSRTAWGIARDTRCDPGARPVQTMALLEAPFYSRALVQTRLQGETVVGVHEALDLARFRSPLVKAMLALRVPRRARWP